VQLVLDRPPVLCLAALRDRLVKQWVWLACEPNQRLHLLWVLLLLILIHQQPFRWFHFHLTLPSLHHAQPSVHWQALQWVAGEVEELQL
jgi:hypothetical protein